MRRNDTQSSQLGIVNGIRQPTSDMTLVVEPSALFAPEMRKGRLYILTEANPEAVRGRDACQTVSKTIQKVFYEDGSYSITAALRKAIVAANKALYQHNFSASPQKRATVGVTCAVIKDTDLYIAQVTPSQAYVWSDGKLRSFPTNPVWNGAAAGAAPLKSGALGSSLTIEPDFYRSVLRPNDALLLCSSNITALVSLQAAQDMLRAPSPNDMLNRLAALCQEHAIADAQALACTFGAPLSPAAQAAPLSRAGVVERGRLLFRSAGDHIAHATGELVLLARPGARATQRKAEGRAARVEREQVQLSEPYAEPPPMPSTPMPRPLRLGESIEERVAEERHERPSLFGGPQPRPHENTDVPPSMFLGESTGQAASTRHVEIDGPPTLAMMGNKYVRQQRIDPLPLEPTLGERLTQPFSRAAETLTEYGRRRRRRRPPPSAMPPSRRRPGLSYRRERPPFPWLRLLLLVTLVTLLIVYGRGLVQNNQRAEASNALDQAEQAVAAVHSAPDETTAQLLLDTAAASLAKVRATGVVTSTEENRQRMEFLERDYQRSVASIEKLTYFDDLTEIGAHPQAAAAATFSAVVVPPPPTTITNTVAFSYVYALDKNAGVIYRMPKNGGAFEPILSPNDAFLGDGLLVGKVKTIAWREDNIVAIAQAEGGSFVYYFRNGDTWNGSNLSGSEEWQRSVNERFQLVTFDGNLYVWGALPGQILKYPSGQTGVSPVPWITDTQRDTNSALDLLIDRVVYLLQPNGSVLVYDANVFSKEIPAPQAKPPLVAPTGFSITGETADSGLVFIVDTQNERIIEADKATGKLIQQIRAPVDGSLRLNQLTSLYVDQSGPQPVLYMVNGGQILRGTLPAPPAALQPSTTAVPAPTTQPTTTP